MTKVIDELDGQVAAAWRDFREELALAMQGIEAGDVIALQVPCGEVSPYGGERAPYIQVRDCGFPLLRVVLGCGDLNASWPLELDADLIRRGWSKPDPEWPGVLPSERYFEGNWRLSADHAKRIVKTLRKVLGVPHPSFLGVWGHLDGDVHVRETLGLTAHGEGDWADAQPVQPVYAWLPESHEQLQELVDDALAPRFQGAVEHDVDGDIVVAFPRGVLFVRVLAEELTIQVFSPVLFDVTWSDGLGQRLSQLNLELRFASLAWRDGSIWATAHVSGTLFAEAHLSEAIDAVRRISERAGAELARRFGGLRYVSPHSTASEWGEDDE